MSNNSPNAENELQRRVGELEKNVNDMTTNLAANHRDFVDLMEKILDQHSLVFRAGDPITKDIRKFLKNLCDRCPPCCAPKEP